MDQDRDKRSPKESREYEMLNKFKLLKYLVFFRFRSLGHSISNHVGRKIQCFGRMLRHVGAIWTIFGQLAVIRGQHGIIVAHLGSSLGIGVQHSPSWSQERSKQQRDDPR